MKRWSLSPLLLQQRLNSIQNLLAMRRLIAFLVAGVLAISCGSDKSIIKGSIKGLNDSKVVLKHLAFNTQEIVDTIPVEEGKIFYRLKTHSDSPEFYYLYYNSNKIASFVILPGNEIKFSTDTLGNKVISEGSEETLLLQEIEKNAAKVAFKFDSLVKVKSEYDSVGDTASSKSVDYQLGSLYVKQKQGAIKHIYTYPNSITNVPLLYQQFPNGLPIFADSRDVMLFKRVCDSLSNKYPKSTFVANLKDEIAKRDKILALNDKIEEANISGHPDISLPDINSRKRSLSEFEGNVILLSFWSSQDVNQKMMNQELMKLYRKYNDKGFEIYQVSVDMDKTAWARAVTDQQLPWISVCDGKGPNSSGVVSYNVNKVPSIFLISKDGSIVAKDIFGEELEQKVSSLLR